MIKSKLSFYCIFQIIFFVKCLVIRIFKSSNQKQQLQLIEQFEKKNFRKQNISLTKNDRRSNEKNDQYSKNRNVDNSKKKTLQ